LPRPNATTCDFQNAVQTMVGKIESLGGNLGDIAWIDEAGLA
jgi:hypothetical protein